MVSYRKATLLSLSERYRQLLGGVTDSRSLRALLLRYIGWRTERNYSERGTASAAGDLYGFIQWCECRGLHYATEITRPILERYQSSLHHEINRSRSEINKNKPLSVLTQKKKLKNIQVWFKWLTRQSLLLANPASELELPKVGRHLPRYILSVHEVEQLLALPDLHSPVGQRDRAIMELLWSTGIRRAEVAALDIYSIDRTRRIVTIRQGKGRQDRIIPIGERALGWVVHYQDDVRSRIQVNPEVHTLFLSSDGIEGLRAESVGNLVRRYVKQSGIHPTGSCHLFRHAMATQMLENGADTRWIQAMLGHASLESTQVYTRISIRMLQAVHDATHPAEGHKSSPEGAMLEPKTSSPSDSQ